MFNLSILLWLAITFVPDASPDGWKQLDRRAFLSNKETSTRFYHH
jgi:hypothetical protein